MEELMNSMELEELLDVSWAVRMRVKGMGMPEVRSARVQELVERMLRAGTKEQIEELRSDLCAKIVKVNKEMVDPVEAERVLREFLAEEA
ncbi:MAG: hypothetical protein OSJ59_03730 [Lachnospiraceae bacterium]|nr:hypothetical protein [Lachnospiraceae bacterium]